MSKWFTSFLKRCKEKRAMMDSGAPATLSGVKKEQTPGTMDQVCYHCGAMRMSDCRDQLPCPKNTVLGGVHVFCETARISSTLSQRYPTVEEGKKELVEGLRTFLRGFGFNEDIGDKEMVENTPQRFVDAMMEMTEGYGMDPAAILSKTFEDSYDEVVILRRIEFTSLCEHHLLPFAGTVDVGYIPGKVVGLSKLARLVDCFSRRFQMQERMTRQIAEALQTHLGAKGVAVVSRGVHSCMCHRGVRKEGAEMICSTMLGNFRDEPEARAEFLSLCRS